MGTVETPPDWECSQKGCTRPFEAHPVARAEYELARQRERVEGPPAASLSEQPGTLDLD